MLYFLTVNYHSTKLIEKLIDSIDGDRSTYRFIIINNSPEDLKLKRIESEYIKIIESEENIGFGSACNLGLSWIYQREPQATVWIINPDAYLQPNSLEDALHLFNNYSPPSILGTLIYTPSGDIWFGGGKFIPYLGEILSEDIISDRLQEPYIQCDWVSGCSMLIKLSHFHTCPQFDRAYFLYYEDFDFCRRYASQGHQIAVTNRLAVIHQPSSITNRNIAIKLKHSTYSYLITLQRYTNRLVFSTRFLRILLNAFILLPLKPQTSLGKISGIIDYCMEDCAARSASDRYKQLS